MEKYKLDNYFEGFSKELKIWTLDLPLAKLIFSLFLKDANIDKNEKLFFKTVYGDFDTKLPVNNINEENGFRNILENLKPISFLDTDQLFLIWDKSNIDVCSIGTLKDSWDSIWYGPADESVILFIPNKIIVLICDWGEVKIKILKDNG